METDCAKGGRPAIWALSDGSAGNARQARALALAVARRAGGEVCELLTRPRAPYDRLPAFLWPLGGARAGGWPFSALEDPAPFRPPWPALAVGAGRRSAPIVAALGALGRESGAHVRTAQVLNPQMRLSAFDAVIAPAHDGLRGANVLETLGALNDLDPAALRRDAATWERRLGHLPQPRVAVLVGGPSRSAAFGARALERLCDGLARLAVDGAGLMITPSRRTPRAVVDRLADAVGGLGGWVWPGVGDNPYPAILWLADAVVATEDSVNMASEAATVGKPLFISPVDRVAPKFARFHEALRAAGAARPFTGAFERWRYEPLREADRAAERVAALLAPA